MEVRSVGWQDFEGLYALRRDRYEQIALDPNYGMVSLPKPPTRPELATWFGELHRALLEEQAVASVAQDGAVLVGLCTIRPNGAHVETRHVGILGLEVLAGHRGKGVGSALLGHALAACPGRFAEVQLSVLPVNERARRLYARHGFELFGTAPRAFQRGGTYHDFLLMRKRIS